MSHQTNPRSRIALRLAIVAICVFGGCDPASSHSFSPARLIALEGQEDLQCPKTNQMSPVLFCQAIVNRSGKVQGDTATFCFGNLGYDENRARFLRSKVVRSNFVPAKVDGEEVRVYVSFRVFFQEKEDSCNVTVLPNLGTQQDEFGLQYFSPQEIYKDGGWLGRIERRNRSRGKDIWSTDARHRGVAFSMSVAVDDLGAASDGRVEGNNFAPQNSVELAVRSLEMSHFIPAIVDGKPHRARYFEYLYIRRR